MGRATSAGDPHGSAPRPDRLRFDGEDPDCASWYADWLLRLSELPELLGTAPVRSHLVHALVELDRDFAGSGRWEDAYAAALLERFGAG